MRSRSLVALSAAMMMPCSGVAAAQATAPASSAAPASPAAPSELEQARTLINQGESQRALALLDPIIVKAMANEAKDPKAPCPSAISAALLGMMMRNSGPIPGRISISVTNDFCDALLAKGYALTELKRTAEAEQTLATLVGHDPQNPQYLIEYAFAVRSNGGNERALALYQQAEQLAKRSTNHEASRHWQAVALRGQGFALSDLKRWDEAVRAYRRSQKFEPNDPIATSELRWIEQNRPH